jgi:hypothetical protein
VLEKSDSDRDESENAKGIKQAQTGLATTQALRSDRVTEDDVF